MGLVLGRLTGKYSEDFESVAVDDSDSASDQVLITANGGYALFIEVALITIGHLDCLSNSLKWYFIFESFSHYVILLVTIFPPFLGWS